MRKIVIIGASILQNPLILKAKEMGFETHVFAWADGSIGEKTADYFYPISIIEKDEILKKCREIAPDAVVTIASDLANITVNYVAQNLNLISNSERCTLVSTNKAEMRKAFKATGIPTPEFIKIGKNDALDSIKRMHFPVIVKPTDRSGSRSVTKVERIDELDTAIARAINDSFEDSAIVEEYIDGSEYSCECISFEGTHHFLTITKKYTTGAPHFIEIGHLEPAGLDPQTEERVKEIIFNALDALDIRYGASHSEFKIDDSGNIRIIEIGSRMGGDCIGSDLVQLSTGYDFLKMVIQVALGEAPSFQKTTFPKAAAIKFIFSNEDIKQFEEIQKNHPEIIYRCSDMEVKDANVIDSSSRFGFYVVATDNTSEIIRMTGLM